LQPASGPASVPRPGASTVRTRGLAWVHLGDEERGRGGVLTVGTHPDVVEPVLGGRDDEEGVAVIVAVVVAEPVAAGGVDEDHRVAARDGEKVEVGVAAGGVVE